MFLKSIHIENFRSFKNLEIKELKNINLLFGRNGSGKSSVLDAIFLLIRGTSPNSTNSIQGMRRMPIRKSDDFKYLFNDFRIDDNYIKINATTSPDNKRIRLHIKPNLGIPNTASNLNNTAEINQSNEKFDIEAIAKTSNNLDLGGISHEYVDTNNKKFNFNIPASHVIPFILPEIKLSYINDLTMPDILKYVSEFITNRSEAELVSVLKEIDSNITNIKMGADNTVYIDIESKDKSVPINIMGDGIIKIVSLLTVIRLSEKGIVLIDEIENGLYFKSLESLWKAVLKACRLYNVQVIATTHSYECLSALSDIYSKEKTNESIYYIRLDKIANEHSAVYYTADELKAAIDDNMEIR